MPGMLLGLLMSDCVMEEDSNLLLNDDKIRVFQHESPNAIPVQCSA